MSAYSDIMLDLETMGTGPDAAIVAIGAVAFEAKAGGTTGPRFERLIDLESAVHHGGVMDAATVQWWLRQPDAARGLVADKNEGALLVLHEFRSWVHDVADRQIRVWGNGADFDNVILSSAYRRAGAKRPWGIYRDRCYRTVRDLMPDVPLLRVGTHHRAVDDAESQAWHLLAILQALQPGAAAGATA